MHIFYCAGGKFREVVGVFLIKKHSLDALTVGTGRSACVSGVLSVSDVVRVKHRTLSTGRGLDPVCASGVA